MDGFFGNNNSFIWIILLLCMCGNGCGDSCCDTKGCRDGGCGCGGGGGFGGILPIILLLCCCGGNGLGFGGGFGPKC